MGVVDEETRGGLEGGAEVLEEGYFCFCETNLFVEVVLGVVVMVE